MALSPISSVERSRPGGDKLAVTEGETRPRELAPEDRTPPGLDEHLARECVRGLVRSAAARGADPATRLRDFRTLQHGLIARSRDPATVRTAEQLVCAVDLVLKDWIAPKS
ncbi:hypothetical protein GCM10007890_02360 [Methylobacterium tardum]|uniref:Uncharacterized protein n=1 Tax=Methylobacterium tardum TaxID=374432 RepID=A0AA37TBQ5_9HYPH|nr:hypothetical protein GCM10007890_02360 [Methylobacterium tardum]